MSFDAEAKVWDNDPAKVERAKIFAEEISSYFHNAKLFDAMEFGCGTGLLSFELKNSFKSVTLFDTSKNMIDVLKEKINLQQINHFKPLCSNLLKEHLPDSSFDVIYTLMTLHHIINLAEILNVFNSLLNPGGHLCIADLVKENGSFHSNVPGFEGHNGFDKAELTNILLSTGFEVKLYKIFYELEKKIDNGTIKKYPLFLMIAKRIY
jgi:ubiquinone/menaquinone biosynthesis C-methylase UbiE